MSGYNKVGCKHIFSNGTEFELFVECQCAKCSRFRNAKCRIYSAIIKAMLREKYFPYDDLWEFKGIGGKVCKSFTTEPIKRHKKQIQGQVSIYE